jgi:hypothetical protein
MLFQLTVYIWSEMNVLFWLSENEITIWDVADGNYDVTANAAKGEEKEADRTSRLAKMNVDI